MSTMLIKNGFIVTEDEVIKGDLLIADDKIVKISEYLEMRADIVINALNNIIFPGGIDAHTHMELPYPGGFSCDSFETGSRAALHGATTTIIDFANQQKGKTLDHALKLWHKKAKDHCCCDYKFHISITDVDETTLDEMKNMYECQGIYSFKTFLTYPDLMISPDDLEKVMLKTKELGGVVTLHAEMHQIIEALDQEFSKGLKTAPYYHGLSHPDTAEEQAIALAITLAEKTQCPLYIVHLSCKKGLDLVSAAKKSNKVKIFAETCPQYLLLDNSLYKNSDHTEVMKYILSPPLRTTQDQEALWQGVLDKTIDVIATDHCPFTLKQKKAGLSNYKLIPNGIPGVENRFELMFSECVGKRKMTLTDFSKLVSTNPAQIFKLYPHKGVIAPGADADLVIFNKDKKWKISKNNHHMNVDYNPYEGFLVSGKVQSVMLRGNLVIHNEKLVSENKSGVFVY